MCLVAEISDEAQKIDEAILDFGGGRTATHPSHVTRASSNVDVLWTGCFWDVFISARYDLNWTQFAFRAVTKGQTPNLSKVQCLC